MSVIPYIKGSKPPGPGWFLVDKGTDKPVPMTRALLKLLSETGQYKSKNGMNVDAAVALQWVQGAKALGLTKKQQKNALKKEYEARRKTAAKVRKAYGPNLTKKGMHIATKRLAAKTMRNTRRRTLAANTMAFEAAQAARERAAARAAAAAAERARVADERAAALEAQRDANLARAAALEAQAAQLREVSRDLHSDYNSPDRQVVAVFPPLPPIKESLERGYGNNNAFDSLAERMRRL